MAQYYTTEYPATSVTTVHCFKVLGMVKVTKSNLHDFWYRCLVMGLIHIHKILCRSQLVCNNYRRNKKRLIHAKFQVIAD